MNEINYKNFILLGKLPIPAGIKGALMKDAKRHYRFNRMSSTKEVVNLNTPSQFSKGDDIEDRTLLNVTIASMNQYIEIAKCDLSEVSVLVFKDVDLHDDSWNDQYFDGRRYAPIFFHTVLSGSGVLKIGANAYKIKRGDVFGMNPNVKHAFKSDGGLCITACITGCRKHIKKHEPESVLQERLVKPREVRRRQIA